MALKIWTFLLVMSLPAAEHGRGSLAAVLSDIDYQRIRQNPLLHAGGETGKSPLYYIAAKPRCRFFPDETQNNPLYERNILVRILDPVRRGNFTYCRARSNRSNPFTFDVAFGPNGSFLAITNRPSARPNAAAGFFQSPYRRRSNNGPSRTRIDRIRDFGCFSVTGCSVVDHGMERPAPDGQTGHA